MVQYRGFGLQFLLCQDKIEGAWRKKVEQGVDYNRVIQNKKAFRNPSIYDKLIIHCNIDELGGFPKVSTVVSGPGAPRTSHILLFVKSFIELSQF